jgi:Beta-lactamase
VYRQSCCTTQWGRNMGAARWLRDRLVSVRKADGGALGLAAGLAVAGPAAHARRPLRDPGVSARLQAALEARVAAGAPGALARMEAPRAGLMWGGSAGYLARGSSRVLRPDDAFRAAGVTKSVTAAVAVRLAHQGRLALDEPLAGQLAPSCFTAGPPWMLFRALRRASCSRTRRACLTTSLTRRSPRGCVRSRAAPGVRPSWWTTALDAGCITATPSTTTRPA